MNQAVMTRPRQSNRVNRLVRTLHIYSSMVMLLIMLFFTITGFTLNHRDWFSGESEPVSQELLLPAEFTDPVHWQVDPLGQGREVHFWLNRSHQFNGNQVSYEWLPDEQLLVIDLKRPGGYSIAEVDLEAESILLEQHDFGMTATLNDLHMGRYSGQLWSLFIDISAIAMLLFTLTGFWLVLPQKKRRNRLFAMSLVGFSVMAGGYLMVLQP